MGPTIGPNVVRCRLSPRSFGRYADVITLPSQRAAARVSSAYGHASGGGAARWGTPPPHHREGGTRRRWASGSNGADPSAGTSSSWGRIERWHVGRPTSAMRIPCPRPTPIATRRTRNGALRAIRSSAAPIARRPLRRGDARGGCRNIGRYTLPAGRRCRRRSRDQGSSDVIEGMQCRDPGGRGGPSLQQRAPARSHGDRSLS
jgi:hypothetical protein